MKFLEKISHRIKQFADLEQKNNVITVRSTTPLFSALKNNVRNEYLKYHHRRKDEDKNVNIFIDSIQQKEVLEHAAHLYKSNFLDNYTKLSDNHELPFSITEEIKGKNNSIECVREETLKIIFPKRHILRTSYFVSGSFSQESFHHIQREHKIWFMKYGSYPGVYKISDQRVEPLFKLMSIQSSVHDKYDHNVEKFKLYSLKENIECKDTLERYQAKISNRKKEVIPEVIECTIDLNIASMSLLFDAANLSEYYTALHRRIAPYQLALISKGDREHSKDLDDLAKYIELLIGKAEPKIKVLNELKTQNYDEIQIGDQLKSYDEIGIPYNILLDESALKDGLFKLRNRNTTLSETIHLSDVTDYLIKIFNSGWNKKFILYFW